MAEPGDTVVPKVRPQTEAEFRATWRLALARLCKAHGESRVALWLGVTERQLRNYENGTLPSADKLFNLLAYDASAHDEIDGEYGLKNVGKDAVCSTDPLTLDMIALAHETAKDEADDSPGGTIVTDHELLAKDEVRLRRVHRTIGTWLDRIDGLRRPRAVRSA